jgi:hypothetical protein
MNESVAALRCEEISITSNTRFRYSKMQVRCHDSCFPKLSGEGGDRLSPSRSALVGKVVAVRNRSDAFLIH